MDCCANREKKRKKIEKSERKRKDIHVEKKMCKPFSPDSMPMLRKIYTNTQTLDVSEKSEMEKVKAKEKK